MRLGVRVVDDKSYLAYALNGAARLHCQTGRIEQARVYAGEVLTAAPIMNRREADARFRAGLGCGLACFQWPAGTERARAIGRFTDTFFERFEQFLRPPRHPKWREVNLAAQVPGWTRYAAAAAALERMRRTASSG